MSADPADRDPSLAVTRPRPGHADLAGSLKYDHEDVRNVLERASARETTARVAAGGLVRQLLEHFGVAVMGYCSEIGGVTADHSGMTPEKIFAAAEDSQVRMADADAEKRVIELIDDCRKDGDTLGGIVEVCVTGLPVGLGSYVSWDQKLDGRLAGAVMSVQAVKGVELGLGFEGAVRPGSQVHDPIVLAEHKPRTGGLGRASNRAGGLEGGVTTGEPLVVRGAMKPISTLRKRLPSVDMRDGSEGDAAVERSDVCAVPAAGVVAEAMVALVLADAFLDKFGGDSISEIRRNFDGYLAYLIERGFGER
jgi:chorismate synthase